MAVDLGDLVDYVKAQLVGQGKGTFFTATSDDVWVQALANAFWTARLARYFVNYVEADGVVTPINGAPELPRDQQQVIVFFASYNAIKAEMLQLATTTRYKAGPVDAEVQRSATVLTGLLKEWRQNVEDLRRDQLRSGGATSVAMLDRFCLADLTLWWGDDTWVR